MTTPLKKIKESILSVNIWTKHHKIDYYTSTYIFLIYSLCKYFSDFLNITVTRKILCKNVFQFNEQTQTYSEYFAIYFNLKKSYEHITNKMLNIYSVIIK